MVGPFVWDILPAFPPGASPFFPKHQKVQQISKMFHLARLVSFIVLLALITASWCEMTLGVCFLVLPTRLRLVASRCCWATKQMSQSRCRAPVCSCFSPPTATPFIWQSNPKQKLLEMVTRWLACIVFLHRFRIYESWTVRQSRGECAKLCFVKYGTRAAALSTFTWHWSKPSYCLSPITIGQLKCIKTH